MTLNGSRRVAHGSAEWLPVAVVLLAVAAGGCGRMDLGHVRGQVVSNGVPRGFRAPESMRITFSSAAAEVPRTFSTSVLADGTFSVGMNDGSGRGIPQGTYAVAIDTNSLFMKAPGKATASEQDAANEYPRPAPEVIQKLKKAGCTVDVTRGKRLNLTVDLDAGTITPEPRQGSR